MRAMLKRYVVFTGTVAHRAEGKGRLPVPRPEVARYMHRCVCGQHIYGGAVEIPENDPTPDCYPWRKRLTKSSSS